MFTKEERSSFPYWFAHLCAFNMTALNLKVWKFKYLFHDFEKPWLKLFMKDYKKVQKWHRYHNKHHVEYLFMHGYGDMYAMAIDWECSRFTKQAQQLDAMGEFVRKYNSVPADNAELLYKVMKPVLIDLELWRVEDDPKLNLIV